MESQNNYQRGKIYTIRHPDSEKYYIGSTCKKYLSNRFGAHKTDYKRYLNGKGGNISSYRLFDLGADDCYIELLELYPCSSKLELTKREGELIRLYKNDVVNKVVASRTRKEYRQDNKEKIKEYYQDNKETLLQKQKEYNEANKEKKKEYMKEYKEANKEVILQKAKIKYTCDCGSELRKDHITRHERSMKHIAFINSKNL